MLHDVVQQKRGVLIGDHIRARQNRPYRSIARHGRPHFAVERLGRITRLNARTVHVAKINQQMRPALPTVAIPVAGRGMFGPRQDIAFERGQRQVPQARLHRDLGTDQGNVEMLVQQVLTDRPRVGQKFEADMWRAFGNPVDQLVDQVGDAKDRNPERAAAGQRIKRLGRTDKTFDTGQAGAHFGQYFLGIGGRCHRAVDLDEDRIVQL
mmetsp:Transcript_1824/g.3110  ORF Transcript_1824/g.3110 Transcript_1824/m.3110 type:complete len:209 (-) Transcript_1824:217-843(-)